MSDKKNIDRLFQEKFKDFEQKPSDHVWKNIENELKEDKDRRVIPFWWKLSGAAALLLFGTIGFNYFYSPYTINSNKNINPIVIENNKNNDSVSVQDRIIKQNEVVTDRTTESVNSTSEEMSISNTNNKNNATNNKSKAKKEAYRGAITKVNSSKKDKKTPSSENKMEDEIVKLNLNAENITLVLNDKTTTKSDKKEKAIIDENLLNDQQKIAITNEFNKETIVSDKNDSTAVAMKTVEPNALEELLNEKEKQIESQESKINRWQISPMIAPVYFNSYSNGSPIDGQFENNSKTYENSVTYGLGVNYALNTKISVRSGVNRVNLSYNTNDVVFFANITNDGMRNIDQSAQGSMIVVEDQPQLTINSIDENLGVSEGKLNQSFGYLEVPLEFSYKVLDKKFGVQFIGGMSTLFLTENSVAIVTDEVTTTFGEANNLNNVHFSGNIGVGFNYRFLKSFQLNFEPMFKYQLNSFSSDSGNFKPYFIGLYSGISFNF